MASIGGGNNDGVGAMLRLKVVLSPASHYTGNQSSGGVGSSGERRFLTTISGAATVGDLAAKIALELTELFTADAPLDACMLQVFNQPDAL